MACENIVNPVTNSSEAVDSLIFNTNLFANVTQGGITEEFPTCEGNGLLPSLRKAYYDAAAYKVPIDWASGSTETDIVQPRRFGSEIYVPLNVPAAMDVLPDNSVWRLYTATYAGTLRDAGTATEGQTDVTFTNVSYTPNTFAIQFYVNGVKVNDSDITENSNSSIVLSNTAAMEAGDEWEVFVNQRPISTASFLATNGTYTDALGMSQNLQTFLNGLESGTTTFGDKTVVNSFALAIAGDQTGFNSVEITSYVAGDATGGGRYYRTGATGTVSSGNQTTWYDSTGAEFSLVQQEFTFNTISEAANNTALFAPGSVVYIKSFRAILPETAKGGGYFTVVANTVTPGSGTVDRLQANGRFADIAGNVYQLNTDQHISLYTFGGHVDGVTDDTETLQNYNDFWQNGGVVNLPEGDILITDTVFVNRSAMQWRGAGMFATRILFSNAAGGTAISGDSSRNLSMNTYTYCTFTDFSIATSGGNTDPSVSFDYTSFSFSRFNLQIVNRRTNALLYDGQGNNGSSPYYNWFTGYLFGGDVLGGTNYTQTAISSRQGLLGTNLTGSNGANANTYGPFPRCAALGKLVDMKAGNGNMFTACSGESITDAYFVFNDNPAVDSGTSSGSNTQISINDTTKSWGVNDLVGVGVEITGGTGSGQVRIVQNNTATSITVVDPWSIIPDATSTYELYADKGIDNKIAFTRTEGLASSNPDFIRLFPGARGIEEFSGNIGSLGGGHHINDRSGSSSNTFFSQNKVVFTENIQNVGANADIDVYAKNAVFGGVTLPQQYVLNWIYVAATEASHGGVATIRLDVGGVNPGDGDFTLECQLAEGATLTMAQAGPTDREPRQPNSRRVFLNVETDASFDTTTDLQITWCATLIT